QSLRISSAPRPPRSSPVPYTTLFRSVPTTWEDFAAAAQQVREADPETHLATFAPAEFGGFAGFAQQAGAVWWEGSGATWRGGSRDRKSTRLNSSHVSSSYAVFCLKKK